MRIDKPADRSARGSHVYDAGVRAADFLGSFGAEKYIGILGVRSDKDGIALDLLQRLRLLGSGKVADALAGDGHEGRIRRDHNVHGSCRCLHFSVQVVGVNDHGFHLHGEVALGRFLSESQLCLYGLDCRQFGFAPHRGHHFRREGFAFFI